MDKLTTLDENIKHLSTTAKRRDVDLEELFNAALEVIAAVVSFLPNSTIERPKLLNHPRVQAEMGRFMSAPGFARRPAAYELPLASSEPIDIKLFWLKKATKQNLSWVVGLTPNWEDDPASLTNRNLGMDFVVPETADRVFVILSDHFKLRVLELHEHLTHTQREIFTKWLTTAELSRDDQSTYKQHLHNTIWNSFDYEPTNRQFYKVLVEHFDILVSHLEKQGFASTDAKLFTVRLIGRLLFLWFLRKKDFLNPNTGYFNVSSTDDQTHYYRAKLEPLFFNVLNVEMKERTDDKVTPYLNGGLFEDIQVDFYKDSKLTFPPTFFASLFEKLNHYNFTVDEGTSDYEQVAIDPEMLGRVFENLLASLHTETGTQARKSQGAFYTPREIVDYMCSEALIEYLKTKLPEHPQRDQRIEELVTMNETAFRDQDHNKRRDFEVALGKKKALELVMDMRILDPAVGSGAYPMGMLHLLVKVATRLDPSLEKNTAKLKHDILSQSLYGVDIDQMAIQICRLRAWLSILVDMQDLKAAKPLPNLDFKFVCANTLIPLADSAQDNLFDEQELKTELIALRDQYYQATKKANKRKLRDQYLEKIRDGGLFAEIESEHQRQLKDYNPFNPLNSSSFYDPSLMHGVEKFDVVIGNPPYVQLQKNKGALANLYEPVNYQTFARTGDLYALFYEHGLELTKKDTGLLCYITSNKWMRAGYGEKLRSYFASKDPVLLIDFGGFKVFDSATVDTNILLVRNGPFSGTMRACHMKNDFVRGSSVTDYVKANATNTCSLTSGPWFIGNDAERSLKVKIESVGTPLKDWDVDIYRGILTGLNEAFIIDTATKEKLIAEDPKSAEIIKPILRGKDIKRYAYKHAGLYIIATFPAKKINIDDYPAVKNYLLSNFDKRQLEQSGEKYPKLGFNARKKTGNKWYETQDQIGYFAEFEKEKIVWPMVSSHQCVFTLVPASTYLNNKCYLITGDDLYSVIGVLNSKLAWFIFSNSEAGLGGSSLEIRSDGVLNFKIPADADSKKILNKISVYVKDRIDDKSFDKEREIDQLVYQLYNLTPDEIALIEDSAK